MESGAEFWTAKVMLDWQIEMGAGEAISDAPVDRYALQDIKPAQKPAKAAPPPPPVKAVEIDAVAAATQAATAAHDLDGLRAAIEAFTLCPLKAAARNMVFNGGTAGAPVMIITDAPDRDDDRAGSLFTGPKGALFDKMIAAIGLDRAGVYMAPVVPWNPPQNRDPSGDEIAMTLPFLRRHIELASPKILVLMGNAPCQALRGRSGMTRLRGTWADAAGHPTLPMFAPTFLLNTPDAKRDTWADLLSLKSRLKGLT